MEKKSTETRAIAPKIRQGSAQFYERMFPSLNAGATWILEEFPALYGMTLAEMRGKFTRGELCMILDVLNGHGTILAYGGSGLAGQHVGLSIYDSFRLYPGMYEEKWDVAADSLNGKLSECTRWQLVCLEVWAAGFWEEAHRDTSPDEWAKPLLEPSTEGKGERP